MAASSIKDLRQQTNDEHDPTLLAKRVELIDGSGNQMTSFPITAATTGGGTPYKLISATSTNATCAKASAGTVYAIFGGNTNAAVRYIKFYDKASAPTVGTDTPVLTLTVPAATTGAGFTWSSPVGIAFATGIAFAMTTGAADSDTGAVGATELVLSMVYK